MRAVVVTERHRLREKLPDLGNAARTLALRGVPREVRIPGWTGPTFFSSELADGRLRTLEQFASGGAETAGVTGWVIGSMRDPMSWGDEPPAAVFVLERVSGRVLLVDLEQGQRPAFVSSSAGLFLDAIDVFLQWWGAEEPVAQRLKRIRTDLARIDPPAMASPANHWPQWLDDLNES
ncbi:SUKH-4 family immunity protein [Anaeromyxobacter sp. SG66]|uniref:SUKH-4 family immunity protein n=1 Tax=Anaeromyxobacter sp. SG66 TaxID=2925410 RepID=UPI001F5A923D|nr:SUKH-4 family immunity protein [Anaeromyxobacter sp. SG66]